MLCVPQPVPRDAKFHGLPQREVAPAHLRYIRLARSSDFYLKKSGLCEIIAIRRRS